MSAPDGKGEWIFYPDKVHAEAMEARERAGLMPCQCDACRGRRNELRVSETIRPGLPYPQSPPVALPLATFETMEAKLAELDTQRRLLAESIERKKSEEQEAKRLWDAGGPVCGTKPIPMRNYFVLQAPSNIPDPGASLQALLNAADMPALTLHSYSNDGRYFTVVMKRVQGLGDAMPDAEIWAALQGYVGVAA